MYSDMKKCCEKILIEPHYEYPSKTVIINYFKEKQIISLRMSFMVFLRHSQVIILVYNSSLLKKIDRGVTDYLPNAFLDAYYSTPVSPYFSANFL
jgi:hypothetical protein